MTNAITNTVPHGDVYEGTGEVLQLVSFQLGPEEYAIDILGVQEIIRVVEITVVPNAPHFVEGVVNLRGKVIPIISLRTRLGLSTEEHTKDTRIVVVEVGRLILGFIVDYVEEVLRLPAENIEPPSPASGGGSSDYNKGVGRVDGRLLILLDLELLFGIEAV